MKTYLYGIGQRTKNFIAGHPELEITGILDSFQKRGEFCGVPIIDINSLGQNKSEIIIVARAASVKIIYDRIKGICSEKGIVLKDTDGNQITENSFEMNDNLSLFEKTTEEILEEVRSYEIVSFDIFDSLLKRKCGTIEKLWEKIQERLQEKERLPFDYSIERSRAEKELAVHTAPTLGAIYDQIQENTGIDTRILDRLKRMEYEEDRKELYVNDTIANAFQLLKKAGKALYLVTDMYYSQEQIKRILEEKGITGYQDIFISCEYGTGKSEDLFDIYKSRLGFGVNSGKKMIHIGDSAYEDGVCALKHGIDSCLIKKQQITLSAYDVGRKLLAPCLLNFSRWLCDQLKKDKADRILFIARDGFLIKQIYDALPGAIDSTYLLISRKLAVAAAIYSEADIQKVFQLSFDGTPEEMLEKRFQLCKKEIMPYEEGQWTALEYIMRHKKLILHQAERLRRDYQLYLGTLGVGEEEKVGIFDFVSTGTCQACLEKIWGRKLKGYYFERIGTGDKEKWELDIIDYVSMTGKETLRNYFLVEPLIKSRAPSVKCFDEKAEPVYAMGHMSEEYQRYIEKVQQAILENIENSKETKPDEKEAYQRLQLIGSRYLTVTDERKEFLYDEFCNREIMA